MKKQNRKEQGFPVRVDLLLEGCIVTSRKHAFMLD